MPIGLRAAKRSEKSPRSSICATVNLAARLTTVVSVNSSNHSLCQRISVSSRSTIFENWRRYVSALALTWSAVSIGRVLDCPEGSPIRAVQSPTITTMVCPRSWSWRSLRRPTAWPSVKSGALGSNPILRRKARPDFRASMNSSRGIMSTTARSVIQRSSSSGGTRALRVFRPRAPCSSLLTIRLEPLARVLDIFMYLSDQRLGRSESLFPT